MITSEIRDGRVKCLLNRPGGGIFRGTRLDPAPRTDGIGETAIRLPKPLGPKGKSTLRVQILGPFAVHSKGLGIEVTPRGKKARAMLGFLICHAGSKISKTRLAELLWGDRGEKQARASLRQTLLELRRALNSPEEIVVSDRDHVWVSANCITEDAIDPFGVWQDVFEDLDGITADFDAWLASERTRRRTAHVALLKTEAENLLEAGRAEETLILVDSIRDLDEFDEDALRLGMRADFQLGRSAAIVERFERAAKLLQEDLGVQPSNRSRHLRDELIGRLTGKPANLPHGTDREYFARRTRGGRAAAATPEDQGVQAREK